MPTDHATLTYHVASTLDGFIAHDDGSWDGFAEGGSHVDEFLAATQTYAAVLMGRKTYESGLAMGLPLGAPAYPGRPNYVFSQTMRVPPESAHPELTVIADNVPATVSRLKQERRGEMWLCGGGSLASALFGANLIDTLILKINPVLFGSGRALVDGLPGLRAFKLLSTRVHEDTGVIVARYRLVEAGG